MPIKLFGMDVDGTLTDSSVYLSSRGEEILRFNRRDGHGIFLLRGAGIKTLVISGEDSSIIRSRCQKMKIDYVFLGIPNKTEVLERFFKEQGYTWDEFAYIGDDVNDLGVLKKAGLAAAPADAEEENKAEVNYICERSGGHGCVREFINTILSKNYEIVKLGGIQQKRLVRVDWNGMDWNCGEDEIRGEWECGGQSRKSKENIQATE